MSLRVPSLARAAPSLVLIVVGCAPPTVPALAPAARDSAAFETFIERYLERRADADEPDDPAARLSDAAERERLAAARARLRELRAMDTTALSVQQRIDWLLVEAAERRTVADTALRLPERDPGRYLALGQLYWQVAGDAVPTPEDWGDVRRTLDAAPRTLALARHRLVDPPPLWARLAAGTADRYAEFLRGEFVARTANAPPGLREPLVAAANEAREALLAYAAFLRDTLPPAPDGSWAAGAAYYDRVLREAHFLPYTAETMIAEGRRLHAATKLALDSLARELAPGKSWRQLADEMQGRHPGPGTILEAYRRASNRVLAFLIRDDLIRIPPCEELLFVPTPPAQRETYAWAGYGGLRERDGVLHGRFFVTDVVPGMSEREVRDKLRAQNYGWISVIALHEGYPGHHLQNVYARRSPRPLRREFSNTYFGEGWALYAEHWMRRQGLFAEADERLAQLQMRLWRTARVIVDPSLHTGRMTYEEAVRFLVDEVGLTRTAAEAEVNRYTTWPTQAPSYIIGWVEIERLKEELRRELGSRFSEKRFHEALLEQGSLPLALMRRAVREALTP